MEGSGLEWEDRERRDGVDVFNMCMAVEESCERKNASLILL